MHKRMTSLGLFVLWFVVLVPLIGRTATDDATSVIVNIQRSAEQVSSQVLQDLTTRIAELVKRWGANLQKTLALHEQAKKDGQGALMVQFEDQLSRTMQQAGQDLAELLAQREPTRGALAKLEKVLMEGKQFFQEQGRQAQADSTTIADELKTVEGKMRGLAEKHRRVILNGQIPPQLDVVVRELEAQRRTLELRAQIKRRIMEVAASQREHLQQYQSHIGWLQGLSQIAFVQANGQLQTLGDLAKLRHLGVAYAQSSETLAQVAKASVEFSKMVQQTQGLVDIIATLTLPADFDRSDRLPPVEVSPAESHKILKRYLEDTRPVSRR